MYYIISLYYGGVENVLIVQHFTKYLIKMSTIVIVSSWQMPLTGATCIPQL